MVESWMRVPFRRRDALAAGVTPRQLRGPAFVSLFHGVHVSSEVACTLAVRARGALVVAGEGASLSHRTAARLWGGVVPDSSDIDVCVPLDRRVRTDGVRPHRFAQPPPTRRYRGLPLTTPATTFVHLADDLDLVDLVVLGDGLVRRGVVTPAELVDAAERSSGPHAGSARTAAAFVRPGVDSAPETRVRLLLVLAGLPEPRVNRKLRDAEGNVVYRLDLSYVVRKGARVVKVAVEYDGRHHEKRSRRAPDLLRREDLEGDDWVFVVLVAEDLHEHPERTIERVVRVAGREGVPMPRVLSDRWRRHFPVR